MVVAFGQKGRCKMKGHRIKMVVMLSLGFGLLASVDPPPAQGDFVFGPAMNMGPAINTSVQDGGPCISPDGLEFYFYSFLQGYGSPTFQVSKRATINDPWGQATTLPYPLSLNGSAC